MRILKYIKNIMAVIKQANNAITHLYLFLKIIMQVMVILNLFAHVIHASIGCITFDEF